MLICSVHHPLPSHLSCVIFPQNVRMLRFIQEVNTTTRSCALWDLEEETEYIVHVQSISMFGTSPLSEPLRFRTPKEAETQASKSKGKTQCINTRLAHSLTLVASFSRW